MAQTIEELTQDLMLLREAELRVRETETEQGLLRNKYTQLRHWYAPRQGDQWPWDRRARPGKIHMTLNILKPAVDIDSRLQSLVPKIVCMPPSNDTRTKQRAEASEKIILESLEQTGWDVWLNTAAKVRSMLGKVILKPMWNSRDDRPDVSVIETPENLRVGWGSSDFSKMDWALYEYELSPLQILREFGVQVVTKRDGSSEVVGGQKHDDPLGQQPIVKGSSEPLLYSSRPRNDYEAGAVKVWDYWYKKVNGKEFEVWNCLIVGNDKGRRVVRTDLHPEYPDIPYIVIENEHLPGSPDGQSTIENLTDVQEEYNRAISHWLQLIADNVDPAWQAVGPGADTVPPGLVPKAGEIIALGADMEIKPIEKPVNQVPLEQSLGALTEAYHKISGLPEIVFGQMPGAQTSGRAMAVQVEATNNRGGPRRDRLYAGLRELIFFWLEMIERRHWTLPINMPQGADLQQGQDQLDTALNPPAAAEGRSMDIGDVVKGLRRWKVIGPEITPRDVFENTQNEVTKLNARGESLETFMDNTGIDNPMEEIEKIMLERSNVQLYPGDVQAAIAAAATKLQMVAQMMAMQQQQQAAGGGGQALDAANQSLGAGHLQNQEQGAQPAGDQVTGGETAGLAPTGPGGASPAGGAQPSIGPSQTLIRPTPGGQALTLQQTTIKRK